MTHHGYALSITPQRYCSKHTLPDEKHRFCSRKAWFDQVVCNFNDCVQTTTMTPSNGSSAYVVPIQLTLGVFLTVRLDRAFVREMNASAIRLAFTHLRLACEETVDLLY